MDAFAYLNFARGNIFSARAVSRAFIYNTCKLSIYCQSIMIDSHKYNIDLGRENVILHRMPRHNQITHTLLDNQIIEFFHRSSKLARLVIHQDFLQSITRFKPVVMWLRSSLACHGAGFNTCFKFCF